MTDSKNGSAPAPPAQLSLRPHYSQDWPNYNRAQCEEKDRFVELLADLCGTVPEPDYTFGRPRLPLADMVFACAYKVYSGFSSRRFTCDLKDAHDKGLLANVPHFNSVSNYMSNPDLTPTLDNLITLSSLPLNTHSKVAIIGTSELAELTYLALKDIGVDDIEVFERDGSGSKFLGMKVQTLRSLEPNLYAKIVIAVPSDVEKWREELMASGVTDGQVVEFLKPRRELAEGGGTKEPS